LDDCKRRIIKKDDKIRLYLFRLWIIADYKTLNRGKHVSNDIMETTTSKLYKESVEFMKEEGKYKETLADICQRLFNELKNVGKISNRLLF